MATNQPGFTTNWYPPGVDRNDPAVIALQNIYGLQIQVAEMLTKLNAIVAALAKHGVTV